MSPQFRDIHAEGILEQAYPASYALHSAVLQFGLVRCQCPAHVLKVRIVQHGSVYDIPFR